MRSARDVFRWGDAFQEGFEGHFQLLDGVGTQGDPGTAGRRTTDVDDVVGLEVGQDGALGVDGGVELVGRLVVLGEQEVTDALGQAGGVDHGASGGAAHGVKPELAVGGICPCGF